MDDTMQAFLTQLIFFLLIGALFSYVAYTKADPTGLFMRHYGQDTGLIVDTIYAGKGDVQLQYRSLHPDLPFWFNFTTSAVFMGVPVPDTDQFFPLMKRPYGNVTGEPSLAVMPALLQSPQLIDFTRSGQKITFDGTFTECSDSRSIVDGLALFLDAPDELQASIVGIPGLSELLWDAEEQYGVRLPLAEEFINGESPATIITLLEQQGYEVATVRQAVSRADTEMRLYELARYVYSDVPPALLLTVRQGGQSLSYAVTEESTLSKKAACLLELHLGYEPSPSGLQQYPAIDLAVPADSSLDATRAVALALTEMIR